MRTIGSLLTSILSICILGIAAKGPSVASLKIALASEPNAPNPIIRITLQNLSTHPLRVNRSGAFFDYEIQLTDANRHPVRMTKEALDIKSGRGVIVMSATIITLNQDETQQEDLDLARYFDLSSGGPYTLVLARVLDSPGRPKITSNPLEIRTK